MTFVYDKALRKRIYIDRVAWASALLNKVKPTGGIVGVEVGLWKGDFAKPMLEANDRLSWFGIDPYVEYGKRRRKAEEWDAIFERVSAKMRPFGERFTLVRKTAREGVDFIPDLVDFLFVDGRHDYESVKEDITLYEGKVRPGGVMSGHDYRLPGVQAAVDEYVAEHHLAVAFEWFDPIGVWWWIIDRKGEK